MKFVYDDNNYAVTHQLQVHNDMSNLFLNLMKLNIYIFMMR